MGPNMTLTPLMNYSSPIAYPYYSTKSVSQVETTVIALGQAVTLVTPSATPYGPSCILISGIPSLVFPGTNPQY